jgi:hypothetical protein
MIRNLDYRQLYHLIESVFKPSKIEKGLCFLVDLPGGKLTDSEQWQDRRRIAAEWFHLLADKAGDLSFSEILFCCYPNVGSNNNDLPSSLSLVSDPVPDVSLNEGSPVSLSDILERSSVVLAFTELSATAPLKILAKTHGFRGATLPGFTRAMIPALGLDYGKVNARVMEIKTRMDSADGASVVLTASGKSYHSFYDLRFRTGHASGGLMREPGIVGNLPSGEAYIVPYEGEKPNESSATRGVLPVQFDDEIVVYSIEANKAVSVISSGQHSEIERRKIAEEPAYGNISELGIGVLGEWGVKAVGSTLLDEKLGLHIAFGRSEHFGGITGPTAFRNPANVVHIDRVYVPSVQPMVRVDEVSFEYHDGRKEVIISKGQLAV